LLWPARRGRVVKFHPRSGIVMGLAALSVAGSAAIVISPRVRHAVKYRLLYDSIGAPSSTSAVPEIAPTVPMAIRLAVAGDVGTGGSDEALTAAAMDTLEAQSEYDALVLLGDNVYPSGDPTKLQNAVFGPFAAVLDNGTQLLPVLGNHDVRDGNGESQATAIGMPGGGTPPEMVTR